MKVREYRRFRFVFVEPFPDGLAREPRDGVVASSSQQLNEHGPIGKDVSQSQEGLRFRQTELHAGCGVAPFTFALCCVGKTSRMPARGREIGEFPRCSVLADSIVMQERPSDMT
jgi:hypothetical protein